MNDRQEFIAARALADDRRRRRLYGFSGIDRPGMVAYLVWLTGAPVDELERMIDEHLSDGPAVW